jgi:hypothetical protein
MLDILKHLSRIRLTMVNTRTRDIRPSPQVTLPHRTQMGMATSGPSKASNQTLIIPSLPFVQAAKATHPRKTVSRIISLNRGRRTRANMHSIRVRHGLSPMLSLTHQPVNRIRIIVCLVAISQC